MFENMWRQGCDCVDGKVFFAHKRPLTICARVVDFTMWNTRVWTVSRLVRLWFPEARRGLGTVVLKEADMQVPLASMRSHRKWLVIFTRGGRLRHMEHLDRFPMSWDGADVRTEAPIYPERFNVMRMPSMFFVPRLGRWFWKCTVCETTKNLYDSRQKYKSRVAVDRRTSWYQGTTQLERSLQAASVVTAYFKLRWHKWTFFPMGRKSVPLEYVSQPLTHRSWNSVRMVCCMHKHGIRRRRGSCELAAAAGVSGRIKRRVGTE